MSATDDTVPKHSGLIPFKPGQSGNPSGRPRGARAKFGEAFVADLLDVWERKGKTVLDKLADEKPGEFARVAATVLPKQLDVNINDIDDLSADELDARLAAIEARAAAVARGEGAAAGTPAGTEQPPLVH